MSAQRSISCGFVLISELATDPELSPLVSGFIEHFDQKIIQLEQLFQMQDWDELSRLAHQLRGSAGGYGFPTIGNAAGRLEDSLKSNSEPAMVRATVDELASLCQAALRGGEIASGTEKNAGGN
jgi:HPt (histidine-containing phosphotransfer) domain-containing protein